MAHLAFTEGDTEWGDHLTDDEYPARRRRAQATRRSARRSTRPIVVRERGGQRAVCVDLGEQILGLVLDRRNCIGSCDEAERSGGVSSSVIVTSAAASLAGSPPCWPFMLRHARMQGGSIPPSSTKPSGKWSRRSSSRARRSPCSSRTVPPPPRDEQRERATVDEIRSLAAPTFIVMGDQDFVQLDHAAEMLGFFPDGRLAGLARQEG
jgi:hypothetical protein